MAEIGDEFKAPENLVAVGKLVADTHVYTKDGFLHIHLSDEQLRLLAKYIAENLRK